LAAPSNPSACPIRAGGASSATSVDARGHEGRERRALQRAQHVHHGLERLEQRKSKRRRQHDERAGTEQVLTPHPVDVGSQERDREHRGDGPRRHHPTDQRCISAMHLAQVFGQQQEAGEPEPEQKLDRQEQHEPRPD
jgi:hypothetical protein